MTIKQRLFWSNIFMLVIPAIVVIIAAVLILALIFYFFTSSYALDDQEDFCFYSANIVESIKDNEDISHIERFAAQMNMALEILYQGQTVYSTGTRTDYDENLIQAAASFPGNVTLVNQNRGIYVDRSGEVEIRTFATIDPDMDYSGMRSYVALGFLLIIFIVIVAVITTNAFLTRFIIMRIADSLSTLRRGVEELSNGNLDYRIDYTRKDEFLPVCQDFNLMAGELKKSIEKSIDEEKARKMLIAGISHDIRSPLTSIQAYAEGLIDGIVKSPEKQRLYLETIRRKAVELSGLLTQLITYVRSGVLSTSEMEESDIARMIEKEVRDNEEDYRNRGLAVHCSLDPVYLSCEDFLIKRLISNIADNSIRYKTRECARLDISLENRGSEAVLTFKDDGPGVPEEKLESIFLPFYRLDESRGRPENGSGLGLAIVSNIAQKLGGSCRACNDNGLKIIITIDLEKKTDGQNSDN